MAAIVNTPRPLSQILPGDFDLFPSSSSSPPSSSSKPLKRPQGHYRPFSTLYTDSDSPYIELKEPSRLLKRASSLGGLHPFRAMNLGLTFKPKKNTASVTPPGSPTSQLGTPSQKVSYPLSLKQRLKTNQDGTKTPSTLQTPPISSVKKKRSVMSLFTTGSQPDSTERPPDNPDDSPRPSTAKSVKFKPTEEFSYPDDSSPFVRKSVWATRFNMKLHPYQTEVPYMQAYTPILLENDRYADLLLQRLGGGYPSFGEYRAKAPLRALDLGCGQGNWIMYASTIWAHTHFTGFDLVDITTPAFQAMDNTAFVQGNFIKFPLPFADASFDYVRLANLVLCIPYTQWDKLFTEVKRILTVGGRVEVIDDELHFPYASPPKLKEHVPSASASRKSAHRSSASSFDMDDDDLFSDADLDGDTLQGYESGEDSMFNTSEGTCVSSSFDDKEKPGAEMEQQQQQLLSASETARPNSYARWRRHASTTSAASSASPSSTVFSPTSTTISSSSSNADPYAKPAITDPYLSQPAHAIWAQRTVASRELEAAFVGMLAGTYGVYPRPAEFVVEFMQTVFGRQAGKTQSFHVRLAEWGSPIGVCADVGGAEGAEKAAGAEEGGGGERESKDREKEREREKGDGSTKKPWMTAKDWEKKKARRKEQVLGDGGLASVRVSLEVSLASPIPDVVKPKAAKQLGLPIPPPPSSSSTTTSSSKSKGYSSSASTSPSLSPGSPNSPVSFASSSSSTPTSAGTGSGSGSGPSSLVSSRQHSPVKMAQPKAPNAKTAALLGMSYTELVAATAKALQTSTYPSSSFPHNRHHHYHHHRHAHDQQHQQQGFRFKPAGLVQSPGLLIGRDRYVPVDAQELEMHACKYMHTLLGCRPALAGYIARFRDEKGGLLVDEDMFGYYLWEYETFRRIRLGWSSQIHEKDEDDSLPTANGDEPQASSKDKDLKAPLSSSSSHFHSSSLPQADTHQVFDCQPDEPLHIRTIRVFEAIKMVEGTNSGFARLGTTTSGGVGGSPKPKEH